MISQQVRVPLSAQSYSINPQSFTNNQWQCIMVTLLSDMLVDNYNIQLEPT